VSKRNGKPRTTYQVEYLDGKSWRPLGLASADERDQLVAAIAALTARKYEHRKFRIARYRRYSKACDRDRQWVAALRQAVNNCCSCGGAEPGKGCRACELWHEVLKSMGVRFFAHVP